MTTPPGDFRVCIVGAGLTGLFAGHECAERGYDYTIFEKGSEVGGTWRDNVYPGIAVDSAEGFSLGFFKKYDWERRFPAGHEIFDYLKEVADRFDLRPRIRFNTEVTECRWEADHWRVETADGAVDAFDAVIMATGFLRVPKVPKFDGGESFTGPSFHSSAWDTTVEVSDKRIGVIGTGSSGIQLTSALGRQGVSVTQFIRTPQWVRTVENPRYSWALRKFTTALPRFGDWLHDRRLQAFQQSDPRGLKYGDWRRFRGYGRRRAIEAFHEDLNTIRDPELRAKMTPHEMPGCKRIPLANDYYEVIQQPNVTIHRGGIRKIVPEGIVTDDGNLHELDVIVYATGFDSHAYFNPIRVVGRDGASLGDLWKGGPFSYRGIMVPGFPNIFVIHGPYTPVNNISVPLATEDQLGYVMQALETSRLDNIAFSPTEEATDRYLRWIRSSLPGTTWGSKQCANWYTAADGYVLIFPFGRDEHKALYDSFDREDCEIEVCAANGAGISAEATQPSGR